MTGEQNDLELIVLDELEDRVRCEMRHYKTPCSEHVTHLAIDCQRDFFVCQVAEATIAKMMEMGSQCAHCERRAKDCWRVVPA